MCIVGCIDLPNTFQTEQNALSTSTMKNGVSGLIQHIVMCVSIDCVISCQVQLLILSTRCCCIQVSNTQCVLMFTNIPPAYCSECPNLRELLLTVHFIHISKGV